jgi:lipid-A-disaccharide synthase
MRHKTFMLIAGEASGDLLAAELVYALREEFAACEPILTHDYQPLYASLEPRFFGAGGPRMATAGVDLAFDLTAHSVTGLSDVLKDLLKFRRLLVQLYELALEREPDAIICVDFGAFNLRLAHAIREYVRYHQDWFHTWNPKIIQYVSPQVWASREGRARQIARDFALLLSIIPFEKEWYAKRVPQLLVEFVGHPIVDLYASAKCGLRSAEAGAGPSSILHRPSFSAEPPLIVLLPGSRPGELSRHLPVMFGALAILRASFPNLRARMVLPTETLVQQAKSFGLPADVDVQSGGLPESLAQAHIALASTGTVTLECAYFGVPTVAMYKTSWMTFQVARHLVTVKHLAMPNLLAKEEVFPEFLQHAATPENIARAAVGLLRDDARRTRIKSKLAESVASLGPPGASHRAASAILRLLPLPRGAHSATQLSTAQVTA